MARVQLRLLHERCSPARDSFPPAFPFLSNFEISYPIPSYTLEFSNIFTFRSPSRFSPDASERTESVKHFTFSIGEFFSNAMRRYAKRKNDNFPTHPSSLSLCFYSAKRITERELHIRRVEGTRPGIYVITSACRFCGRTPFPEPR